MNVNSGKHSVRRKKILVLKFVSEKNQSCRIGDDWKRNTLLDAIMGF